MNDIRQRSFSSEVENDLQESNDSTVHGNGTHAEYISGLIKVSAWYSFQSSFAELSFLFYAIFMAHSINIVSFLKFSLFNQIINVQKSSYLLHNSFVLQNCISYYSTDSANY